MRMLKLLKGRICLRRCKMGMRFLRYYESKARQEHFCTDCMFHILPGEIYSGRVFAYDDHGIIVNKNHLQCPENPWKKENESEGINSGELEGIVGGMNLSGIAA